MVRNDDGGKHLFPPDPVAGGGLDHVDVYTRRDLSRVSRGLRTPLAKSENDVGTEVLLRFYLRILFQPLGDFFHTSSNRLSASDK